MTSPSPQSKQEVRFAVVMYGGVSLAIYINGVAQELLRLVRSTAPNLGNDGLRGTERVYREVSYLLADEEDASARGKAQDTTIVPPTRFIVDILSGTSAGGINGIFLAKALVNGQDMDQLKDLWIKEGDIETLINDKRSIEKPLKLQDPPVSLLNSQRMFYELLKAFNLMDNATPARSEIEKSPYIDELDLFVTSTDLQGVTLPISLSDGFVYEKRHRNVMHFVYSEPSTSEEQIRNDFHRKFNPFLAYAARCTSSFPFAFEPMSLSDIDDFLKKVAGYQNNDDWKSTSPDWYRFYHDYQQPKDIPSTPFPERAFGDGGYLDNKPFTYATETVMSRTANVPVDRKLIFIEPSPEHPEDDVELGGKPDAIDNVMSALLSLPRYETIREDLQRINERNRLIDRVSALTTGVDRDENQVNESFQNDFSSPGERWKHLGALVTPYLLSDESWAKDQLSDKEHADLDLTDVIKRKGRAYAAYIRLRVSASTDELAKLITRVAGYDENSEYSIIIRSMIRAWRVKKYIEHRESPDDKRPTVNRFLFEFDLGYPMRRVNYLRNKVDALSRFERDATTVIRIQCKKFDVEFDDIDKNQKLKEAFSSQVLAYKSDLNKLYDSLRRSARSLRARRSADKAKVGDSAVLVSPLNEQIAALIKDIDFAIEAECPPGMPKLSVLDYFLSKRETETDEELRRSYKAASPEELCIIRAEKFLENNKHINDGFEGVATSLSNTVVEIRNKAEEKTVSLFTATSTEPLDPDRTIDTIKWIAKYCVGHYYQRYEDYDLLTYPILYDTDVGEADIIDVIRVSPEDAKQLIDERTSHCHKLAGTALGHFGAFLQGSWRENDILWGRLDGAERIITALLPNHPRRKQLIGKAHATIICETVNKLGPDQTNKLLAESLMRTQKRKPDLTLLNTFISNLFTYCEDEDLKKDLERLIAPPKFSDYYEANFAKQSKLDPETTLKSLARATNVIGKILESLSSDRRVDTKYALWIARLGQIFFGLVQVAVPQSFANIIFRHILKLVYFMELLLIVGGALLAQPQMQQFGVTAFGITAGINLAVIILGDLIKSQNRWLNLAKAALILAIVILVALGALTLSGLFGVQSSWRILTYTKDWILTPAPFGFNLRTFFRFGTAIAVLLMFLFALRSDIKAVFQKQRKTLTPATENETS
jgi:patatin-related protein